MPRPFKVTFGKWVGLLAFVSSLGLFYLYLPGNPSALNGIEWTIVASWLLVGLFLYFWASRVYTRQGMRDKMDDHLEN